MPLSLPGTLQREVWPWMLIVRQGVWSALSQVGQTLHREMYLRAFERTPLQVGAGTLHLLCQPESTAQMHLPSKICVF